MAEWANIGGALITLCMACMGLLKPQWAANIVSLEATSVPGKSEFRATYGGLFIPLGLVPLVTMDPLAFLISGTCWLGAAAGRIVSIAADDANTSKNWGATAFEAVIAFLLLVGAPISILVR
jgi:Domain of unknown function (DUF4345)